MFFARITKVDERKQLVQGIAAQGDVVDKSQEVLDWASSLPFFRQWSEDTYAATGGKSYGNVRAMHGNVAAGKLTSIDFDNHSQSIVVEAKIVDSQEWEKVLQGVYTGFSIGGRYIRKWTDTVDGQVVTRYTAAPSEISIVDKPCIPTAKFFDVIKRDGSVCRVAFQRNEDITMFTPRDENHGGRSAAASIIKSLLTAPSGDLAQAFGKSESPRREQRLVQGVSRRLEKKLAKAGMRIRGPVTAGVNGVQSDSVDVFKSIHASGPRKASPISVPPQSSNATPAPTARRADLAGGYPEYRTPAYEAPPHFGAAPHSASEHDHESTPPGNSDQFQRCLDALKEIYRRGPRPMWQN